MINKLSAFKAPLARDTEHHHNNNNTTTLISNNIKIMNCDGASPKYLFQPQLGSQFSPGEGALLQRMDAQELYPHSACKTVSKFSLTFQFLWYIDNFCKG